MTHPSTIPEHAETILGNACVNHRNVEEDNWNAVFAAAQAVHNAGYEKGARDAKRVASEREAELYGQLIRMTDRWETQRKMIDPAKLAGAREDGRTIAGAPKKRNA